MDNKLEKGKYRSWAKEVRKALDMKQIGLVIEDKIKKLGVYDSAKNVMSYMAKDGEISLNNLFKDNSKIWFLPVVSEKKQGKLFNGSLATSQIVVAPYILNKTKLVKNRFNILEPKLFNDEYFDQIERSVSLDLIFVPALCFDKQGNRLGFGGGFYDSFLRLNSNSFKIGVCPKECLTESLPVDKWDIKVDLVLTQ